ncbi:MAG TPA: hypothetical protein VNG34_04285 [Actinomycetota bacterium]|nr:hypothetical protein [Actinomycetota bacterium]
MARTRPTAALVLSLVLMAAACTGGGSDANTPTTAAPTSSAASNFAAQIVPDDFAVNRPERVQVGIFSSTQDAGVQVVSFGDISVDFAYRGTDGSAAAQPGPSTTFSYLPAPMSPADGQGPALTNPSDAAGVYQGEGIRFDKVGVWTATIDADVDTIGPLTLETNFAVRDQPALPAPGQKALKTENLTVDSKDVKPVSIDSRAQDGDPIPDPELHQWTIADAIAQGRPALVLFATPVYCQSHFCGPSVEALQQLAADYPDKAVYIHVEIWRDYNKSVVNQGAADWLYRNDNLTEPWLYLIDDKGVIADRWGPLFDTDEVGQVLSQLPDMKG